jgi:hypothetical protein
MPALSRMKRLLSLPRKAASRFRSKHSAGKSLLELAGDKAKSRAEDMYKSAGLQLIEARARGPDFSVFLRDHCNGLSRSRAYELIDIAEGKADEVGAKNRTRDRRRREKAARVREPRTQGVATKKRQPPKSKTQWALAEFKVAVDVYFAEMDDEAKRAAFAYVQSKISVTTS